MPRQWFIDVVADEKQNVQAHGGMVDDPPVAAKVFQVADSMSLKKTVGSMLSWPSVP